MIEHDKGAFQEPAEHAGPQRSIRARLLLLALGVTLLALGVITFAAFEFARNMINQAQQVSSESLQKQAEQYLVQINDSAAGQNALILDRSARDVEAVAETARLIFSGQVNLPENIISMTVGPEGQRMNGAEAISSVFVPYTTWNASTYDSTLNHAIQQDIELTGFLDLTLPAVKNNNPNASAIYMGTINNVLRYYPNIQIGKVVPADFEVTKRPWYVTSLEGNPSPDALRPIWSPVYFDATGLGLVSTIAMPVYSNEGVLTGVVGLDVTLEEMRRNIEDARFLVTGYSFVLDQNGAIIIMPDAGYQDLLNSKPDPDQPTPNLIQRASDPKLVSALKAMVAGERGFTRLNLYGREFYMAYTPLSTGSGSETTTPGWSLASIVATEDVLSSVAGLQAELAATTRNVLLTRVLPAGVLIALVVIVLAWWSIDRLVKPILQLSASAQSLGAGDWEASLPALQQVESQNNDEIGFLAHTMETMAGQLRRTFGQLEQRVADRTRELEHRTHQIQAAAEVAREITAAQNLDTLLNKAVNLISERFGYYNVGIFLVDDTSEYAHLMAASGDLGKRLIQSDIRLRVGEQGLVGYVTRFGIARRSQDVRQDSLYQPEPLLPDTISEVTLPLRSEGRIIGALDVQKARHEQDTPDRITADRAEVFSDDDVTALQALADQMATAIENVRLVERTRITLQETDQLFQQQAAEAWRKVSARVEAQGMEYDRMNARPLAAGSDHPVSGATLKAPVTLRGQVIGYIGIESDDPQHMWTEDEIAIVESTATQAALSVENARLLAESQRRALSEKISAEIGAKMLAALDPQVVLRTAVEEVALQLGITEVAVELLPEVLEPVGRIMEAAAETLPEKVDHAASTPDNGNGTESRGAAPAVSQETASSDNDGGEQQPPVATVDEAGRSAA